MSWGPGLLLTWKKTMQGGRGWTRSWVMPGCSFGGFPACKKYSYFHICLFAWLEIIRQSTNGAWLLKREEIYLLLNLHGRIVLGWREGVLLFLKKVEMKILENSDTSSSSCCFPFSITSSSSWNLKSYEYSSLVLSKKLLAGDETSKVKHIGWSGASNSDGSLGLSISENNMYAFHNCPDIWKLTFIITSFNLECSDPEPTVYPIPCFWVNWDWKECKNLRWKVKVKFVVHHVVAERVKLWKGNFVKMQKLNRFEISFQPM